MALGLDLWVEFTQTFDPALLDRMLAPDVVFESPVVFSPQRGKNKTTLYLRAIGDILKGTPFEFINMWTVPHSVVLEFATEIEGIVINGVDILGLNEDELIATFKVMLRPLRAVNLIHSKMRVPVAAPALDFTQA